MLHWITIVAFLGLAATAAVARNVEAEGISDVSQQILESKNADNLDSSVLHRVPRSSHHRRQHHYVSLEEPIHHGGRGRSSGSRSQAFAGRAMGQAGRGNIFNWDIDASSGKKGKKGVNKVQTDDASLENN